MFCIPWDPARPTCRDKLAFIWVVQHSLEEGVGEEAAAAVEGGQVPDDATAIAAACHALLTTAGLHLDAVHCTLVLLHNNTAYSCDQAKIQQLCGMNNSKLYHMTNPFDMAVSLVARHMTLLSHLKQYVHHV